jgi:hypothetical protein
MHQQKKSTAKLEMLLSATTTRPHVREESKKWYRGVKKGIALILDVL